jgi:hypothetical protein
MTEDLDKAQGLLETGDIAGLLRHLRTDGDALPLEEDVSRAYGRYVAV